MYVARLHLTDFRSYSEVDLELGPGPVSFVGANGQGKTNLVEAVDYVARLSSHRVSSDAPLVRFGAERAYVRAEIQRADRSAKIEIEINPGKSNRVRLNGSVLPRAREVVGIARTVIFSPEDLTLVKGDPSDRRRFLDDLLVLRTPRYAGTRSDVDRILRQRNSLLKSARGRTNVDLSTLDVWDDHLARAGAELTIARLELLDELAPFLREAHLKVALKADAQRQQVAATYRSSVPGITETRDRNKAEDLLLAELHEKRAAELERGVTLAGPHRDDVDLNIGNLPAKGYASHGETWSLALALKLASHELLRSDGDDPILILDDVFAELDEGRRDQVAGLVVDTEQVLITAAVEADIPEALTGIRVDVQDGTVRRRG